MYPQIQTNLCHLLPNIAYVQSRVVAYHVNIVAIGYGLLKKVWPIVKGYVLHTARNFLYLKLCRLLTSIELINYYVIHVMTPQTTLYVDILIGQTWKVECVGGEEGE